jgi:hypothetical protein
LGNYQNFKLNYRKEELNYKKASKSTFQDAFRIKLQKSSFSKRNWEKVGLFGLAFGFFKSKSTLKAKPNTPLDLVPSFSSEDEEDTMDSGTRCRGETAMATM